MLGGWLLYIWQSLHRGHPPPPEPLTTCPVEVTISPMPVVRCAVLAMPLEGARVVAMPGVTCAVRPMPAGATRAGCC